MQLSSIIFCTSNISADQSLVQYTLIYQSFILNKNMILPIMPIAWFFFFLALGNLNSEVCNTKNKNKMSSSHYIFGFVALG